MAWSETSPSPAPWPTKQERPTGGWPAGPPPTIKSVKCLYREERMIKDSAQMIFCTPFLYPYVLYVCFVPVKHKAPRRRLIPSLTWFDWSHKYWRLPATKVRGSGTNSFRCPKSHLEGKSGPTLGRGGIFLNNINKRNYKIRTMATTKLTWISKMPYWQVKCPKI